MKRKGSTTVSHVVSAPAANLEAAVSTGAVTRDASRGNHRRDVTLIRTDIAGPSWAYRMDADDESVYLVADKVLRQQVDWMVKNAGVSEDFPAVVKHIWFSYLTEALPDVAEGVEQVLVKEGDWALILRDRDISHLLDVPRKSVKPILKEFALEWEKYREEYEEELDEPEAETTKGRRYTSMRKPRGRRLPGARLPVRFVLPRLPAIIILALRICEDYTLVSDILRWMRTSQFPYLAPELDPDEMNILATLNPNNELVTPEYAELEFQLSMLTRTLNLEVSDLPPVPLATVVKRFLEELNLPSGMLGVVMGLVETLNSVEFKEEITQKSHTDSMRRSRGKECFAMSCLVYAVRILFGLDGKAERKISIETRRLQKFIGSDHRLFNFEDWVDHMNYRRLQLFRHTQLLPVSSAASDLFLENHDPHEKAVSRNSFETTIGEGWRTQRRIAELMDDHISSPVIILPPTHRPFRAHTEILSKKYPKLSVSFANDDISHLYHDRRLPKRWKVPRESREEALLCLARIKGAQSRAKEIAFPYRSHAVLGSNNLNEIPSSILEWLLEICGEIIALPAESILGQILFLEIVLYPRNPKSIKLGKGHKRIKKMKHGE